MKLPWLTTLLMFNTSCATFPSTTDVAQSMDVATTTIALNKGYSEANPLWHGASWPVMLGAKLGVSHLTKLAPKPVCQGGQMGLTLAGFGASIWNVGTMLGSGPASIPLILLTSYLGWDWYWADALETCNKEESP